MATLIHSVELAADLLSAGELVAFPTETVYGLGADAENMQAVSKIYAAKNRPQNHPLIVHLSPEADWAYWADVSHPIVQALIEHFCPGPLTLILPKAPHIPVAATGGQDSIGLRCPSHSVAQALLRAFSERKPNHHAGVAAPSANKFGRLSPTQADHVLAEFHNLADLHVLAGDASEVGIESTILDVSRLQKGVPATLLRPGHITSVALAEVLGYLPRLPDRDAPRASGTLKAHYAPRTPMAYYEPEKPLLDGAIVLAYQPDLIGDGVAYSVMPRQARDYAHKLYARLHELDKKGYSCIYVQKLPKEAQWLGVQDRLQRAIAAFEYPNDA